MSSVFLEVPSDVRSDVCVEVAEQPNPKRFVPVFDWNDKVVWVWMKSAGSVVGPVALEHSHVIRSKKFLSYPAFFVIAAGQMDPFIYKGPNDIYPMGWSVGDPFSHEVPEKADTSVKYKPPVKRKTPGVVGLPVEFEMGKDVDPHGYKTVVDKGSGSVFTVLPNGEVGKWEEGEGVYYIVVKEEGEWGIDWDSSVYSSSDVVNKVPSKKSKLITFKKAPKKAPKKAFAKALEPDVVQQKLSYKQALPVATMKGVLKLAGKKDEKGFDLGEYGGEVFSVLPEKLVGMWSSSNGAYILYEFDSDIDCYVSTGKLWSPPGVLSSGATVSIAGVSFAELADHKGTRVLVLPDGRFVKWNVSDLIFDFYKIDVSKGKIFEPTGERIKSSEFKKFSKASKTYQTLKPKGTVDDHGLPEYDDLIGGDEYSMLPNGEMGLFNPVTDVYHPVSFYDGVWHVNSDESASYSLADIDAMYVNPGVSISDVEKVKKDSDKYLVPTGSKNEHGFPTYVSTASDKFDRKYVVLPDGSVFRWEDANQVYVEQYYHLKFGWFAVVGGKSYSLEEFTALMFGKSVDVPQKSVVMPTAGVEKVKKDSPADKYLVPSGDVDEHGFSTYRLVSPLGPVDAEHRFVVLPDGSVFRWVDSKQGYVKQYYDDEWEGWFSVDPEVIYEPHELSVVMGDGKQRAVQEPVQLKKDSPADKYLVPTGNKDFYGFPTYKDIDPDSKKEFIVLPDGSVFRWRDVEQGYVEQYYDDEWEFWFSVPVGKVYSPKELSVLMWGKSGDSVNVPSKSVIDPISNLQVVIPSKSDIPDPDDLEDLGSMGLAGAGEKTVLRDPTTGKQFIFKLAAPKGSPSKTEEFRAAAQESFSDMAADVRPGAYVQVKTVSYKGRVGTLQPMLTLDSKTPDLEGISPEDLTDQQKTDIASEHLLDWLMSQHDSFSSNFLVTKEGRVVGIDKEQGWKYVEHSTHPDRLSVDYKPNADLYGEEEPYYNEFWKAFASGKMDFDPVVMLEPLSRIESVSPDKMKMVLRRYVEASSRMDGSKFKGDEHAYERYAFEKKMLSRRSTLRADFEKFITDLYRKRTGDDGEFTFNNGWVKKVVGDLENQRLSKTVRYWIMDSFGKNCIKPHEHESGFLVYVVVNSFVPLEVVLNLLDSLGVKLVSYVPWAGKIENPIKGANYNRVVIRENDLDKVVERTVLVPVAPVREFSDYSGFATYHVESLAPPDAPGNVDDLKTVHAMKLGHLGKNITLDSDAVEQQTASVQRVIEDGKSYYLVHFKLRKEYWVPFNDKFDSGKFTWPEGKYDPVRDALVMETPGLVSPARVIKFSNDNIMWILTEAARWAFRGSVYVGIREVENVNVKSVLVEMLKKIGLDVKVMQNPSVGDIALYNHMQALWALAPGKHSKLRPEEANVVSIRKKLKGVLTKAQLDSIRQVRSMDGRGSVILPGLWRTLGGGTDDNPVVRFLFWTVSASAIPIILKTSAVGIHERLRMGVGIGVGTSETSDMVSGGADCITVRLATRSSEDCSVSNVGSVSRDVKLILSPELLDRLDVHISVHDYESSGDSYGCTNPNDYDNGDKFKTRKGLSDAVRAFDDNKQYHMASTEVVLRRGVPSNMIKRICVNSEGLRKKILGSCVDSGIEVFNGCPIEDFVVVDDNQGAIYSKYLKPIGY